MLIEWITIITVLLIVGILLHGWRQMRNQQGKIKMSPSIEKGQSKIDTNVYGSEFPSGGARVVSTRDDAEIEQFNQNVSDARLKPKLGVKTTTEENNEDINRERNEDSHGRDSKQIKRSKINIPQQVSLNLNESVPMLMDVDEKNTEVASEYVGNVRAGSLTADVIADEVESDFVLSVATEKHSEPVFISEPVVDFTVGSSEPVIEIDTQEPDEVIVINAIAKKGTRFNGQRLMDVLLDCDLRFGEMDIFHRHEQAEGEGAVLFSMVNMIKPGTFSLSNIQSFETPGVSLFMTLPMNSDPIQAFNALADTAHQLQKSLNADLKDEDRCAMTLQTLEHYRQRICDYQRKECLNKQPRL